MSQRFDTLVSSARVAFDKLSEPFVCGNCQKQCAPHDFYRCLDCKMALCEDCMRGHFGNRHEPHPIHRHEIRAALLQLFELAERWKPGEPDDADLARLWRAHQVLDRFAPEEPATRRS